MSVSEEKQIHGFTLTEIIVTVIIVAVLAGLALPRFSGTIERAKASEGVQILTALLGSQKTFKLENGTYTATFGNLDVTFQSSQSFILPPTVANPADPVASPIATTTRSGGYTLGINENGTVSCCNNAGITCASAGYPGAGAC